MKEIDNLKKITYHLSKMIEARDEKIAQEISCAEIISFDIFDTLIKRNVIKPEYIHNIVCDKFMKQTGIILDEYPKIRIEAEKKAKKQTQQEEICLNDIYNFMNDISEHDKKKLSQLEEEIELEVCCPNLWMKKIYETVLKNGKRIIITSDMYLDEHIIKKILQKCGYIYYEKLYLSSSLGVCKATGNIYEIIKKDYSEYEGKILHIGDNLKRDYIIPRKKGINALLIDGRRNLLRFWKKNKNIENKFLYQRLYSLVNNHISDGNNDAVSIAYEVLGPMLLGYCIWLNEKIKKDKVEKIFFLSREGKIFQEAYNILYPQNNIPQTYLYVSRQALLVPLLTDAANFDEIVDILKCFLHAPFLSTISNLCGLDQKRFNNELLNIGLNEDIKIHEIPIEKKEEVYSIIKKIGGCHLEKQKEYVIKYLQESGVAGNIAIVDIGWSGTMQAALQKYMADPNTVLHGYYLGVRNMEMDDYYTLMLRSGYLFEPGKNKEFDLMIRFTQEILEILFLNQVGSVKGYASENDKIVPVFFPSEYSGSGEKFIKFVQIATLDFLRLVKADKIWEEKLKIQEDIIMSSYSSFAVYPAMSTIKIFTKFHFMSDGNIRKLLPEHSLFYYLFHLKKLKQDFSKNMCKIFFIKQILKINLPYFKLLELFALKFHYQSDYRKRYYHTESKGKIEI